MTLAIRREPGECRQKGSHRVSGLGAEVYPGEHGDADAGPDDLLSPPPGDRVTDRECNR